MPTNFILKCEDCNGSGDVCYGDYGGAVRVWDLKRENLDPPLVPELAQHPEWAPDGDEIVWYGTEGGILFRAQATGGAVPEQGGLFEAFPLSVLEDGRVLHYWRASEGGSGRERE